MKKARQTEYQKLQRKARKEKKDAEKFLNHIKQLDDQLSDFKRSCKCSKEENDAITEFETLTPGDIIFGRDYIAKKIENRTEQSDDPSTNIVSVENGELANVINDGSLLTSDEIPTPNNLKSTASGVPKAHGAENIKGKPTEETLCASDSDVSKIHTNGISAVLFNEGM